MRLKFEWLWKLIHFVLRLSPIEHTKKCSFDANDSISWSQSFHHPSAGCWTNIMLKPVRVLHKPSPICDQSFRAKSNGSSFVLLSAKMGILFRYFPWLLFYLCFMNKMPQRWLGWTAGLEVIPLNSNISVKLSQYEQCILFYRRGANVKALMRHIKSFDINCLFGRISISTVCMEWGKRIS